MQRIATLLLLLAFFNSPDLWSGQNKIEKSPHIESIGLASDRVLIGKVIGTESRWEEVESGDTLIITKVKVETLESLKGEEQSSKSVEFEIEGGTVGNITLEVSDYPEIQKGEKLLVFLKDSKEKKAMAPTSKGNGIFKLSEEDKLMNKSLSLSEIREKMSPSKK